MEKGTPASKKVADLEDKLQQKENELKNVSEKDTKDLEARKKAIEETTKVLGKTFEEAERMVNGETAEAVVVEKTPEKVAKPTPEVKIDKTKTAKVEKTAKADKEKVKAVSKDIKANFEKEEKEKEIIFINDKLKKIGLSNTEMEENKAWQDFSKAEKFLIIEQASQSILSHTKELGEKRFNEKNTIKTSWNPLNMRLSVAPKIWHKLFKSVWISKEEKDVLKEVEKGEVKPEAQTLNDLVERQADLKLNIVEKDGKAFIEFTKAEEDISPEAKIIIDKYNQAANDFSKLPDSWKTERAAKSTDKLFTTKNHEKYENAKASFEEARASFIENKAKEYEKNSLNKKESKQQAMNDAKDIDKNIAMLQFTNTNPDAMDELNKIRNESSWGRLVNNENIWRSGYIAAGATARAITHTTLGLLAAPLTAGVIGGIRARRKANENINTAFKEGTTEETFLERKEAGKKGLFDDKNKETGIFSKVMSGAKVNTKEVAAFVDADSQKQRIDSLINKINTAKTKKDKILLMLQLEDRVNYIELKEQQGLMNYGNKNPIAKNYELFKSLSEAYMVTTTIGGMNIRLTKEMKEDIAERDKLLQTIMSSNEDAFGEKMASYKNKEMLRGAAVAGGLAVLGQLIMGAYHHDGANAAGHTNPNPSDTPEAKNVIEIEKGVPIIKIIEHTTVTATADHGHGAIATLRELQHSLKAEYGNDLTHAPASVKHILETDVHKLAQEYGMYKPGQDAESAFIKSGSTFKVDGGGNLTYHEGGGHNDLLLEKGTDVKADHLYEGKMSDTDHSGSVEGHKLPEQVDGNTGTPVDQHTGPEVIDNLHKLPPQVDAVTGEPVNHDVIKEGVTPKTTESIPLTEDQAKGAMMLYLDNKTAIFGNGPFGSSLFDRISKEDVLDFIKPTGENPNWKSLYPKEITIFTDEALENMHNKMAGYLKKLMEITGEKPRVNMLNEGESTASFLKRGLEKATSLGKSVDVTLKN